MTAHCHVFFVTEDFCWCVGCLTNAVTVCKAKDAFDLVKCDMLLDLNHISVEFSG